MIYRMILSHQYQHHSPSFREEALVHEGYILTNAILGLEAVVVYVVHFEAVVRENLIPDLFDPGQLATREHVLHALHLHVQQLVRGRLPQAEIQLETTKDWLLVDLQLVKV